MKPFQKIKGLSIEQDPYDKYNEVLEPKEDKMLKARGFHIIDSMIALMDSSGMNKTIVLSISIWRITLV